MLSNPLVNVLVIAPTLDATTFFIDSIERPLPDKALDMFPAN
jgi:hypothetical protein